MSLADLERLFGLRGKVALVTGASSGLGKEFARGLAMAGADVAIAARRLERLQAVAADLETFGVRAHAVQADLQQEAQIEAAVREVHDTLGPIDILVNNAGIAPVGRAERHGLDKWRQTLDVNLTAVFLCCQYVGRRMIERGAGGRIINITSVLGEGANSVHRTIGYAATKGAVTNLTRQLAVEWAPHGITVNALAPSWFPTEMITDPRLGRVHDEQRARMEQLTPLGRLGREGELFGAIIYLASPSASYVTGAVLHVDGGWRALVAARKNGPPERFDFCEDTPAAGALSGAAEPMGACPAKNTCDRVPFTVHKTSRRQ